MGQHCNLIINNATPFTLNRTYKHHYQMGGDWDKTWDAHLTIAPHSSPTIRLEFSEKWWLWFEKHDDAGEVDYRIGDTGKDFRIALSFSHDRDITVQWRKTLGGGFTGNPINGQLGWKSNGTLTLDINYSEKAKAISTATPTHLVFEGPNWMSANRGLFYPQQLNHILLPGTHDSGTYGEAFKLPHIGSAVLEAVDAKFAAATRAQSKSIADQLNDGIRFFDLRFIKDGKNGPLIVYHGDAEIKRTWFKDSTTTTIFKELLDFHKEEKSKGEVIVLLVKGENPAALAQLKKEIGETIGPHCIKVKKPMPTLAEVVSKNQCFMVMIDGHTELPKANEPMIFWPQWISSSFFNEDSAKDKQDKIRQELIGWQDGVSKDASDKKKTLGVDSWGMDTGYQLAYTLPWGVVKNLSDVGDLFKSLEDFARHDMNPSLIPFMGDPAIRANLDKVSAVTVDFYQHGPRLVEEIVNHNLLRIPTKPPTHHVLSFNGQSNYVEIPDSPSIDFQAEQEFTVEVWTRVASTQSDTFDPDNDIVSKWKPADGYAQPYPYVIRYLHGSGKVYAERYDGTNMPRVTSKTSINDGKFHHVCFVVRNESSGGRHLFLYVDGRQEAEVPDTTTATTANGSNLFVARRGSPKPNDNWFKGEIGGLRIWDRALAEDEILVGKSVVMTGYEANLVGYWPLNDDADQVAKDMKTESKNGKIVGAKVVPAEPVIAFQCLGKIKRPEHVYLCGRNEKVQLVSSTGATGTHWQPEKLGNGIYAFRCLDTTSTKEHVYLNGHNGTVGLAPSTSDLGTHWQREELEGGVVYRCLDTTSNKERVYLNGRTRSGKVDLAPNTDYPYTGTYWRPFPPV